MSEHSPTRGRPRRWLGIRRSPITHLALALLVLAIAQAFVVKPFRIPSESMSPTLETGDRILVSRTAYIGSDPAVGDVVVFSRPRGWDATPERDPVRTAVGWVGDVLGFGPSNEDALVKRIIGGPSSSVRCCSADGHVEVDGMPLAEDYVLKDLPFTPGVNDCNTSPVSPRCFGPIAVPADSYLVLGDNRQNSSDSVIFCRGASSPPASCARFIRRSDIVGKVVMKVWPPTRFGVMP